MARQGFCCGCENTRAASRSHKALVCAFQGAQCVGWIGGHFAIAYQPVRGVGHFAGPLGQCKNPVPHRFGPALGDKALGVCNQQSQDFVPRAGINELGDGSIGLAVGCQHVGRFHPQRLQGGYIQPLCSARAQKLAKQRVKGAGGCGCRNAAGCQSRPCKVTSCCASASVKRKDVVSITASCWPASARAYAGAGGSRLMMIKRACRGSSSSAAAMPA